MSAEALNCPNCGAGVASDRTFCEFCKTRLKTVGCVKCLGLMFVGSRFCGHCGAIAAPIDINVEGAEGNCPRCKEPLESLRIGETVIRGCTNCDGVWLGVGTFENLCLDREKQSDVLGFFDKRTVRVQPLTKINYVACPECGQLMNRNNFARASGVIVDICKQHGVWFDADELPSIIEFVQRGGMEIARQRELLDIEEKRGQLREEQRKIGIENRKSGLFDSVDETGIRGFLSELFD